MMTATIGSARAGAGSTIRVPEAVMLRAPFAAPGSAECGIIRMPGFGIRVAGRSGSTACPPTSWSGRLFLVNMSLMDGMGGGTSRCRGKAPTRMPWESPLKSGTSVFCQIRIQPWVPKEGAHGLVAWRGRLPVRRRKCAAVRPARHPRNHAQSPVCGAGNCAGFAQDRRPLPKEFRA